MPQPPPSAAVFILLAAFLPFFAAQEPSPRSCSAANLSKAAVCPPFTSTPPFPFSFSPGCGHPAFQISCPSPSSRATISIDKISFSLLRYEPNSTSLTLSPFSQPPRSRNCSSPATIAALDRSISLAGSPFRVSDSLCSRLFALKPCPPPNLPNCSVCSWECKLIKNPRQLIHECGSSSNRHREDFQPECHGDVLGVLDNVLTIGFEIEWEEDQDPYFSSCKSCKGFCGFNSSDSDKPFLCFPPQSPIRRHISKKVAILSIIFLLVSSLVAISVCVVLFGLRGKHLKDAEEDPTISYLRRHRSSNSLPPVFTFEELDSSTNRFDLKRKLGDGGFGSVYLGHLKDGGLVAVKHLHKHNSAACAASGVKGFTTKSFCNEILILSSIHHPNLVKLHGYCSDPRGLLLVYDYVPNGTLAEHLHGKRRLSRKGGALTWNTRIDIAVQTALAIEYLHFSIVPPVVHRDITTSNIFVEKDMRVKVGDFGLSRLLVCSETNAAMNASSEGVWTGPQGTPGYLDPDYYRSFRLNEKSDIYSFGVVLLELITGMRAVDQAREKREMTLVDMAVPRIQTGQLNQVVDPVLVADEESMEGVNAVAELAFRCVAMDKDDRPDAREVVVELKRIKARWRGSHCGSILKGSNSSNVVVPDEF